MAASSVIGALSVFLGLNSAQFSGGLKKAGGDVGAFKGLALKAFGAISTALGAIQLGQLADRWSDLTSRMTNATGSVDAGANALDRLQRVARTSYSSIEQTAGAFLDQATTLNALKVPLQTQLDMTEALNNTLVISAVRGDRAAGVLDAWGKAMALGALRGDELNQVITTAPRLAQALADQLGVTVLELRKMGEEGKITREVMLGITGQLGELREEAGNMPATIGDGFLIVSDAIFQFVGRMDQAFGVSGQVADLLVRLGDTITRLTVPAINAMGVAVDFVSDNMDFLLSMLAAFIATRTVLAVIAIAGSMISLAKTIRIAGIVTALFTKITRAKVTVIMLAAAAVAKLTGAYDMLVGWLESATRDLVAALPEDIVSGFNAAADAIMGTAESIDAVDSAAAESLGDYQFAADQAAASIQNVGDKAEEAGEKTKSALEVAAEKAKDFATKVGDFFKGVGGEIKGLIAGTSSWNDVLLNVLANLAQVAFSNISFGGIGNGDGSNGIMGDIVGGFLGGLFGFKDGGSFKVGGAGGIDSQVVAFKASPDETVSVMTPAQQREAAEAGAGGKAITINNKMIVNTPDARSFKASEAQTMGRLAMATQRGARTL